MKRKLLCLLMIFALVLPVIEPITVQAVSKINKVKTIYKKILIKGKVSYKDSEGSHSVDAKSFYLLDIDKNGTPELIIKNAPAQESFSDRYIYTVKNGKIKYCGQYYQRGDAELQYSAKYKSIRQWWWTNGVGGVGDNLYKMTNYKFKEYKYLYTSQEALDSDKILYWYGDNSKYAKKVSKKKYDTMSKKYLNNIKKYNFYDNTSSNLEKVFG